MRYAALFHVNASISGAKLNLFCEIAVKNANLLSLVKISMVKSPKLGTEKAKKRRKVCANHQKWLPSRRQKGIRCLVTNSDETLIIQSLNFKIIQLNYGLCNWWRLRCLRHLHWRMPRWRYLWRRYLQHQPRRVHRVWHMRWRLPLWRYQPALIAVKKSFIEPLCFFREAFFTFFRQKLLQLNEKVLPLHPRSRKTTWRDSSAG